MFVIRIIILAKIQVNMLKCSQNQSKCIVCVAFVLGELRAKLSQEREERRQDWSQRVQISAATIETI